MRRRIHVSYEEEDSYTLPHSARLALLFPLSHPPVFPLSPSLSLSLSLSLSQSLSLSSRYQFVATA
jgi:hypothetical protein